MTSKGFNRFLTIFLVGWFLLQVGFSQNVHSVDWKWLGKDANDCQWYYDAENVRHLPEAKALVWLKRMVNDEQRNKTVWERVNNRLPVEGYDRWAYETGLMELDCQAATIRQLSINDYDKDGMFLKARKIGDNLKTITRDSIGEMAYRAICSPKDIDPKDVMPRFPSRW
jgi:hypothetical protein